jgi:hypothetical protein
MIGVELGFGPSAFETWERTTAPTNKSASENKTTSLIERMKPPQNDWGLGDENSRTGKFASEERVSVNAKKERNRRGNGWKTNQERNSMRGN